MGLKRFIKRFYPGVHKGRNPAWRHFSGSVITPQISKDASGDTARRGGLLLNPSLEEGRSGLRGQGRGEQAVFCPARLERPRGDALPTDGRSLAEVFPDFLPHAGRRAPGRLKISFFNNCIKSTVLPEPSDGIVIDFPNNTCQCSGPGVARSCRAAVGCGSSGGGHPDLAARPGCVGRSAGPGKRQRINQRPSCYVH